MENNTDKRLDVILSLYRQALDRFVEQSEFDNLKNNPVFKNGDEYNSALKYLRTENYINEQGITPKGEKFVGFVETTRLEKELLKERVTHLENSNKSITLTHKNISLTKWTIIISVSSLIIALIAVLGQFDIIGNKSKDTVEKMLIEQKDTIYVAQPTDSIVELQVKLIDKFDTIKLPAYCGMFMQRMTLKYQVIKIINGHYNAETILINHVCPREIVESKGIENGKIYTMKVKRRFVVNSFDVGQKPRPVDAGDYEIIYFSSGQPNKK
jgi:hypothetical protein